MMAQQPSMRNYSTDLRLARRHGNNVDGLAKLDVLQFLAPKYAPACILLLTDGRFRPKADVRLFVTSLSQGSNSASYSAARTLAPLRTLMRP